MTKEWCSILCAERDQEYIKVISTDCDANESCAV